MVSLPHEYIYRNRSTERVRFENDKEIHNLNDCELENELRDFDNLLMDDLEGSNDMDENLIYGKGLPLEENIHQINEDIGYSHWTISNVLLLSQNYHCEKWLGNIIIYVVLLFEILCTFVVLKLGTWKFEIWNLSFDI